MNSDRESVSISSADIEVYVLTCNRAALLEQTLVSICNQTVRGFRTIVLDNRSCDNTLEVAARFASSGVEVRVNPENLGGLGNIKRAQQLAAGKYVMLFHDDDLMHPRYIEDALVMLNSHPDVVLAGARWQAEEYPLNEGWPQVKPRARVFREVADFASYLYSSNNFHFGSALYRTDVFKRVAIDADTYGKILDRPILLDVACQGMTVLLDDLYIKYRIHENQDTKDSMTGPFLPQVIAMNRRYREIMGNSLMSRSGRMFLRKNLSNLAASYAWCTDNRQMPLAGFLLKAYREDAASILSIVIGLIVNGLAMLKRSLSSSKEKVPH